MCLEGGSAQDNCVSINRVNINDTLLVRNKDNIEKREVGNIVLDIFMNIVVNVN